VGGGEVKKTNNCGECGYHTPSVGRDVNKGIYFRMSFNKPTNSGGGHEK
jgi:hypothetical protein